MDDRLAIIYMGQKWRAVPLSMGGAGCPSNTMSVPSGILIHPTVWPQYTNVTGRYDRITVP